jgi:hypothetical protein
VSFQLLHLIVEEAAFVVLAGIRLERVRSHRETFTGGQQILFVLLFLLVPPLILQVLLAPKGVDAAGAVMLYVGFVLVIWALEWVVALLVGRLAPVERRQTLLMALIGRDTSGFVPFDPPMTEGLAADVAAVERANAAFPRGVAFIKAPSAAGFASDWRTLDEATRALEGRIAEQRRLRLGVAERAVDVAADARGRLDTLQREAPAIDLGRTTAAAAR